MESKSDTSLANGSWAKLYGGEQFKGDSLTLVGPVDMRQMTGPFGVEWGDKVKQVADLSERIGFFEEVKSIKINCTGGGGSGSTSD